MEKKTGHCVAPAGPCYVCGSHDVEGRSLFCESCEERIAIMQEGGDKRPLAIIIYSIRKTRLESEKVCYNATTTTELSTLSLHAAVPI
mgnify:CR=1 FL=1